MSASAVVKCATVGALVAIALRMLRKRRSGPPNGKQLEVNGISPRFANAVTAVRGKLTLKANAYRRQLEAGEGASLPFDRVVECNIGNPQALGQKPITFVRQVLALCDYPQLLDEPGVHKLFPADVIQRARDILTNIPGGTGAYSESHGCLYVRKAIAKFIAERDGHPADPEDIYITDGASEAVKMCLQICLRGPDDAIFVPIPQYPLYSGSINLYGGHLQGYYLDEEGGWALDTAEIRRSIREARSKGKEPRALVVINPGNPTGNTLSLANQQAIVRLCREERIILMADEVYQSNLYVQDKPFTSFKKVALDMGFTPADLEIFSLHSVSKGFMGECGRRGGYVECFGITDEAKMAIYRMIALGLCSNVAGQITIELMLNPPKAGDPSFALWDEERSAVLSSLERRAHLFCDAFNEMEGVHCNRPEGALYLFPQITVPPKAVEAARAAGVEPDAFYAEHLLDNTGICIVPGSGFKQREGTSHLRFAFLPAEKDIAAVVGLMKKFHNNFMKEWAA
mmetsp:Transcript_22112/g.65195  ORF Transcript_22112/g.65195 Transcript_22112/m.65195 type:complete len:514 (+) Transcript_22112:66-1607(+)